MNPDTIQIPNIETELAKYNIENQSQDQTRAFLFNLIIYADKLDRAQFLRKLVEPLTNKFPSRILFIYEDRDSPYEYLRVKVSEECISQDRSFLCDQITIETTPKHLERIPFLVLPHLIPDLPVYLLWGQDPTINNPIYSQLQELASRIIFDSACVLHLQPFCQKMLMQLKVLKCDMMDLNWAQISGWRNIFVTVFDTKDTVEQLKKSKTIQIYFNQSHACTYHNEIQAIYLQGWLAAQLKWKFLSKEISDGEILLNYLHNKRPLEIKLRPKRVPEALPGAILKIDIANYQNNFYQMECQSNMSKVNVILSSLEKCELPIMLPLPNIQSSSSFMLEVFCRSTSEHYHNMLKTIESINWQRLE